MYTPVPTSINQNALTNLPIYNSIAINKPENNQQNNNMNSVPSNHLQP